jgi:mRNA interferase RelE/StbE
MPYNLLFHPDALGEWNSIDGSLRQQLKKKLQERLSFPHVPSARLSGQTNRYKIKLRSAGIRLVYEVRDQQLVVMVLAVGKRDKFAVYQQAEQR